MEKQKKKLKWYESPVVYLPPCPDTEKEARMNALLNKGVYSTVAVLGGITVIAQIVKAMGF